MITLAFHLLIAMTDLTMAKTALSATVRRRATAPSKVEEPELRLLMELCVSTLISDRSNSVLDSSPLTGDAGLEDRPRRGLSDPMLRGVAAGDESMAQVRGKTEREERDITGTYSSSLNRLSDGATPTDQESLSQTSLPLQQL